MKKRMLLPLVATCALLLGSCGMTGGSDTSSPEEASSSSASSVQELTGFTVTLPEVCGADEKVPCTLSFAPAGMSFPQDATFGVVEEGKTTNSEGLSFYWYEEHPYFLAHVSGVFSFKIVCYFGSGKKLESNLIKTTIYPGAVSPDDYDMTTLLLGGIYFEDYGTDLHRYTCTAKGGAQEFVKPLDSGFQVIGVGSGDVEILDHVTGLTSTHHFKVKNNLIATILKSVLLKEGKITSLAVDLPQSLLAEVTEVKIDGDLAKDPSMVRAFSVVPNLTVLSLVRCNLTDLSFIKSLTSLSELDVSYNALTSAAALDSVKATLSKVNLSHNQITEIDSAFKNYVTGTLTEVDISYNAIPSVSVFDSLYSITKLNLAHTSVSSVTDIASLPLTSLNLAYTQIAYGDLAGLGFFTSLTDLDLSGIAVNIAALPEAGNLVSLKLADCGIRNYASDNGLVHYLQQYEHLSELAIGGNELTNSDLNSIATLTKLTSLDLTNSPLTGNEEGNLNKMSKLTSLTSLSLKNCHNFTGTALLESISSLQELNLSGCYAMEDATFLSKLTALKSLHMESTLSMVNAATWEVLKTLLGDDPAAPKIDLYFFPNKTVYPGEYVYYENAAAFKGACENQGDRTYLYTGGGAEIIVSFLKEDYNGDNWFGVDALVKLPKTVLEVNLVGKKGFHADVLSFETLNRSNDLTVNYYNMDNNWPSHGNNNFVTYYGSGDLRLGFYGLTAWFQNNRTPADLGTAGTDQNGKEGNPGLSAFKSKGGMQISLNLYVSIVGGKGGRGQKGGPVGNINLAQTGWNGGNGGRGGYPLEADNGPIIIRAYNGGYLNLQGGYGGEGGDPDNGPSGIKPGKKGDTGPRGGAANQELVVYNIA